MSSLHEEWGGAARRPLVSPGLGSLADFGEEIAERSPQRHDFDLERIALGPRLVAVLLGLIALGQSVVSNTLRGDASVALAPQGIVGAVHVERHRKARR